MEYIMEKIADSYKWAVDNVWDKVQSLKSPWKRDAESCFRLSIVTGDKRGAGTDSNIYVIVHDSSGNSSRILRPHHLLRNDHERGSTTHLDFSSDDGVTPPFQSIEIWRDDYGALSLPFGLNHYLLGGRKKNSADWFLDRLEISVKQQGHTQGSDQSTDKTRRNICEKFLSSENEISKSEENNKNTEEKINNTEENKNQTDQNLLPGNTDDLWVFPVHRWIDDGPHYYITLYDTSLPQHDIDRQEQRKQELRLKRKHYVYAEKVKGGPVQVEELPNDENFSEKFFWTFVDKKAKLMLKSKWINFTTSKWQSFDDLEQVFKKGYFEKPSAVDLWKEDQWFGLQRVQGADSTIIRLCDAIPENFAVPECVNQLLEGKSLIEAIECKRIFICNLRILQGLECKEGREVASPIALFYLNDNDELLPVAIQLKQQICQENPVFTPLDAPNTWLIAKMFYNNAEAQVHQSLTHLGFTHLLMEGVCAVTHRCLSTSHPLFRLLAPHFLYLIAINKRGEEKLINPGGWVDSTMTQGTEGMLQLMARGFREWSFAKTNPTLEIKGRGLLDSSIFPYYPYRDDAVDFFKIIRRYVYKIVSRHYESVHSLQCDWELQRFRKELVAPPPSGIGLTGVPGSSAQEEFTNIEEVVDTLTGIISTCSLGHAAANSQQYAQYAFVPNYPGILSANPPNEKVNYSDSDLVSLLPSKEETLDTIVITTLLSTSITNPLGNFEVQYLFHPQDVKAADEFRQELRELSSEIQIRNTQRRREYRDLDPQLVPNSISI